LLGSAQAGRRGAKQKRNSADLAATRESVVREFLKSNHSFLNLMIWARIAVMNGLCGVAIAFAYPEQSLSPYSIQSVRRGVAIEVRSGWVLSLRKVGF
jgi:hypothetical protein